MTAGSLASAMVAQGNRDTLLSLMFYCRIQGWGIVTMTIVPFVKITNGPTSSTALIAATIGLVLNHSQSQSKLSISTVCILSKSSQYNMS